jgi:glycosyltransferase involved in cell wall biosynthesis
MPEVTVVIPTFNRSETILRAVGSVLSQTHTDLELLVIDDGGSDATPETLARIADPRVRLLHHPHNRGAAAARNTGIQARGASSGVPRPDDQWLPRKLSCNWRR